MFQFNVLVAGSLLLILEIIYIFQTIKRTEEVNFTDTKCIEDGANLALEIVPTPMVMVARNSLNFVRINQAALDLLNISKAETTGKYITDFIGTRQEECNAWTQFLNYGSVSGAELSIYRQSGLVKVMVFAKRINFEGKPHLLLSLVDITSKHAQIKQLEQLATTDGMTGLLNRRAFQEKLVSSLLAAREEDRELCLAFMDLDGLKVVNDTYGHREGDWYINTFVSFIRNSVDESDIVGRIGGDEFAVLFTKCTRHIANDCIQRIQEQLESMTLCMAKPYTMRASIGLVSVAVGTKIDAESLMQKADKAMYRQKNFQRNN